MSLPIQRLFKKDRTSALSVPAMTLVALSLTALGLVSSPFAQAQAARPVTSATAQTARSQANNDAVYIAQMSTTMRQWASAAAVFSLQAFSMVPWNANQTLTPIDYAPLNLYATPNGAYAVNLADCGFQAYPGTPLPAGLGAPIKLSGANWTFTGSNQAAALQSALGATQTYLPSVFGGPWQGQFCASVFYNKPGPQQIEIVTWYVPGANEINPVARGGGRSTPRGLILDSGARLASDVKKQWSNVQPVVRNSSTPSSTWVTPPASN